MSEVKFRAKVLNTNNWIYKQPFHIRGTWYMYNNLWDMVPIEHKTIGQFSGLKDKNGVEVYENDIILLRGRTKYKVVYQMQGFWLDGRTPLWATSKEIEVIGNVYEHPHLLEVAQ